MSKSASKIGDVRFSVRKDAAKCRRSLSVDCRARGSYVPDRKRPSSEERKSGGNKLAVRWGGARKSSINLSEAKRKDSRPLTDKAYQKRKTNELVEFLDETKFNPPISTTKLMAPSKKDFEMIFQHFYRHLDPSYEVKKIEEEAPKILKNLCYPFSVNKSAFVYVARTNWPSLLGVLIWLMDLIKFAMNVDINNLFEACEVDARAEIHSVLLQYILARYHSGVDDQEEEIATFKEIIEKRLAPNLDELYAINEEKKMQLAAIEEKMNHVKQLADQNIQLDKNIETYEDFILKMQQHYQKKKEVCDNLEEELKEKESECKGLQERVSKMQDAYDAQGFDGKKHLNYFETQMKELADKLERKRIYFKEVQDKFHDAQIKYRKCTFEVTDSSQTFGKEYSDLIESLKNVLDPLSVIKTPQVQKICYNFQLEFPTWEIYFNKHSVESMKAFRDSLENVIDKLKRTGEILKRLLDSMNQNLNEAEMKKSEVSMKLQLLSLQENKQEQELDSKIKAADDEISSIQTQLKKISDSSKTLHDEKSALEKIYREMTEELNILVEFYEKKEKELKEYLIHQKEIFEYFERSEKEVALVTENYGNEIAEKLQELEEL